ncbi:hypothetical protein [Zobellia laminariae]|uniref:hypothetical protein n=1 Tax=Zobellia laminariae TaxID=248906 RepID=UPI0026F46802|nr:hypothetical protein [Zobellia laminariae]WKX76102.1 hypothetical protein Q5W13_21435 [Zobellia laminariae]
MREKKTVKRKLIIEGLVALAIALSPIIFYSYKYIPFDNIDSWSVLGMEFTDNGYGKISMAFYFYLSKIIPLSLLITWFTTCKHWWYHVILIPISMYAFQLYSVFSEDINSIDENEILYLLAVSMVVIPIVYFIRVKLVDKYVHGIDLEAMEAELTALKKKQAARSNNKKVDKFISSETSNDSEGYQSLSDKIDTKLSTDNIESSFKQFQLRFSNWLRPKF